MHFNNTVTLRLVESSACCPTNRLPMLAITQILRKLSLASIASKYGVREIVVSDIKHTLQKVLHRGDVGDGHGL